MNLAVAAFLGSGRKNWIFARRRSILAVMKLILSTHNVTQTKAIEEHILNRLDKLELLDRWAIDARVTLEHDHTRAPEKQFSCALRLAVRGPDLFAKDVKSDLYAAIDSAAKKVQEQIRQRRSKRKAKVQKDGVKLKDARRASAEE